EQEGHRGAQRRLRGRGRRLPDDRRTDAVAHLDRVRRWRCGAAAHAWHVEPRQEPATWAAVVAALLVAGREGAALHRAGHAPLRRRRADAGDGAGRRARGDPGAAAPPKRLELGDVSPSWSFWLDASVDRNGAIAFTGSSPGRPTELYYLATPGASPRRLTDLNGETAARQLGAVERLEWQGPDGY